MESQGFHLLRLQQGGLNTPGRVPSGRNVWELVLSFSLASNKPQHCPTQFQWRSQTEVIPTHPGGNEPPVSVPWGTVRGGLAVRAFITVLPLRCLWASQKKLTLSSLPSYSEETASWDVNRTRGGNLIFLPLAEPLPGWISIRKGQIAWKI